MIAVRAIVVSEPLSLALAPTAHQAERLVREAVAEGGRLLVDGGEIAGPQGANCRPVVVIDARPEMALCRERFRGGDDTDATRSRTSEPGCFRRTSERCWHRCLLWRGTLREAERRVGRR